MSCEPLIDAVAAAKLLCTSPRTVKRMAARGEIPAIRVGTRWRFRASALDEWVRSRLLSPSHPCPERSTS